jgi:chaperonin GroEL
MDLKRGIEIASKQIIETLKTKSTKVEDFETIKQVATISANNDEEIGQIIADAMEAVGFDGIITTGESKTGETYVEIVEGMQFNSGYLSPYFINTDKSTVEFEKPLVLIYDGKITNLQDCLQYLEFSNKQQRPLLIISESVDGEALNTLLINKLKGTLKVAAVRAPGFGDQRKLKLDDIAVLTGGKTVSEMEGETLKDSVAAHFVGSCDRVLITSDSTMIIGGHGLTANIESHVAEINSQIANAADESKKMLLKERLAKFQGGVAIIKIGATSEIEAREKFDRIDDALGATRSAVEEGIIPGGGITLAMVADLMDISLANRDQQLGVEILRKACQQPFRTILDNAGISADVVWNNLKSGKPGFNVKTEEYVDMIEAGIIDPVKVTKTALENAVSIAALLLTTDCLMVQKPKNEQ